MLTSLHIATKVHVKEKEIVLRCFNYPLKLMKNLCRYKQDVSHHHVGRFVKNNHYENMPIQLY